MNRTLALALTIAGVLAATGAVMLWAPVPDPAAPDRALAAKHMEAVDQFNRLALHLGCEGSVIDEEPLQHGIDNLVACLEQKRVERLVHEAERITDLMDALKEQDRLKAALRSARRAGEADLAWYRMLVREGLYPYTEAKP